MANKLSDELSTLTQRTGVSGGQLRTEAERTAFASNIRSDISSVVYQYNTVVVPLLQTLSSETGLNSLDLGLAGNTMFTHVTATEADAVAYYSSGLGRALTVKETCDVILGELARLESLVTTTTTTTTTTTASTTNALDIEQVAKDAFGVNYTLDGDGNANLTYSLSQAIDAIGAFFAGFPGTGNTYAGAYPALSLTVLLSQVTIDTTLPQGTITGLTDDLGYIRDFMGMTTSGPETPTYSTHGALSFLTDGRNLEEALFDLDMALAAHASRHETGGADEIDGDHLDIDYSPTNYTPDVTPPEASDVDHLAAHLAGIDAQLGGVNFSAQVLHPAQFYRRPVGTGPTLVTDEYANLMIQTLDFDAGAVETAYATIPIPQDALGGRPSRMRIVGHFVTKPNSVAGGVYAGGSGFAFKVGLSTSVGTRTVSNGQLLDAGWQTPVTVSDSSLGAGTMDTHYVLEWPIATLGSNTLGVMNLFIERDIADPADDWQNDIGLLNLHVQWYV